jgi:hypothetical protein
MPKVSLSEAARLTGKSRVTIHRHIDKGKLTKEIDGTGNPVLDLAELERVYGGLKQPDMLPNVSVQQSETPHQNSLLQRELELLRERLDDKDRVIEDLRHDRNDLRNERDRLLKVIEEQASSVRLLTDQRMPQQPEPTLTPPPRKGLRGWLHRMTG